LIIIGVNAYHGDAAACLVRDGVLVAAVEEERFRRVKHWAGVPVEAVKYCLEEAGIGIGDVDHIAINRNPKANLLRKALFAFKRRPDLSAIADRLKNAGRVGGIQAAIAGGLGISASEVRATIHNIGHHRAHMASAFNVSPFDRAAVVSVDGFGDFVSAQWGVGRGNSVETIGRVFFPHSLGLFYLALTQYLGFPRYGDEYKVMGLAPYGNPLFVDLLRPLIRLLPDGGFELDLDYFLHQSEGVAMVWDDGEPTIGKVHSPKLEALLGPVRGEDEPLIQRHMDIAASAQALYEDAFFHMLNHLQQQTGMTNLALAGGCAMNSVANGKIFERTNFRELYVQPAAGDAGGAIGAAYAVWNEELGNPRSFVMTEAYWGPQASDAEIDELLAGCAGELEGAGIRREVVVDEAALCARVAAAIAEGKVIGWFQGRMEWGPRALGNRSILGDPRRADMKDILNLKIKHRESFRPFAPSILRERVGEWFETDYDVPFMLQVFQIKAERRVQIPAVTHVNGSGRLQTVTAESNPRYHRLIAAFEKLSGVPILLNTSFNENEPVVCRPREALACFMRTRMDMLVLGNRVLSREQD
jgi:carbamoyltransferase